MSERRTHVVMLADRELALGLSFSTLDALGAVQVAVRAGAPGETTGFCPARALRGELEPTMAQTMRVLAAGSAGKIRAEEILAMRPGLVALRNALISYCTRWLEEFSPAPEDNAAPKG